MAIRYDITEMIELNERLMRAQNDLRKTKKLVELNRELEERVAIEVDKNEEQS